MTDSKPLRPRAKAPIRRAAMGSQKPVTVEAKPSAPVVDTPPIVAPPVAVAKEAEKPVEPTIAAEAPAFKPDDAPAPAPVQPVTPPILAAAGPATSDKGKSDMATNFTESVAPAAAKAQALFGDFNARAKAAVEKSAKFGEELTDLAKGNVEALMASSKAAAKGAETLAQEAAEYGKKHFERATSTLSGFAAVKSPTELFQLQSDFARTSIDEAIASASHLSETWLKLAGDVFQPLSSRYAIAAEKIKNAAL